MLPWDCASQNVGGKDWRWLMSVCGMFEHTTDRGTKLDREPQNASEVNICKCVRTVTHVMWCVCVCVCLCARMSVCMYTDVRVCC